jgi:hypothetical protein
MATAAELRQILKEDAAGKNLYDHLTETLMKLLIEKPTNAYDQVRCLLELWGKCDTTMFSKS